MYNFYKNLCLSLLIFSSSYLAADTLDDMINDYKNKSNLQILDEFDKGFALLLKKNGGMIKTAEYEYITSVSVFKNPPVITWSVTMHMQEYKNGLIEMLKTNLEKQDPVKFKEAMQKLENGVIEDMIKNEQVNKIINYNCSRKDYMYLYNRGIAMRYVYKDEKYTSFGDIFIDKQVCNKLGFK